MRFKQNWHNDYKRPSTTKYKIFAAEVEKGVSHGIVKLFTSFLLFSYFKKNYDWLYLPDELWQVNQCACCPMYCYPQIVELLIAYYYVIQLSLDKGRLHSGSKFPKCEGYKLKVRLKYLCIMRFAVGTNVVHKTEKEYCHYCTILLSLTFKELFKERCLNLQRRRHEGSG